MKNSPITEPNMRMHAGLAAPLDSCSGTTQPGIIPYPAAAPTKVASAEVSLVDEEPDCGLVLCPQGSDCAGESDPSGLFDCEAGCGFRGCGACMAIHDGEPHASDSDVMLEMVRSIGGTW